MRNISLRTKFLAGTIGLLVFLGLTMVIFVQITLSQKLLIELQKRAVSIAKNIAEQSVSSILTEKNEALQMLINDYKQAEEDIEYIYVVNLKGEILAHTFEGGFPSALKGVNVFNPGKTYSIQSFVAEKGNILDIAAPVLEGKIGIVHVGVSEQPIIKEVNDIVGVITGIIILVLILGGVGAVIFATIITKPVFELTRLAEVVSRGDLEQKAHIKTKDEIGRLGIVFNQMIERLKESNKRLAVYNKDLEQKVIERTRELEEAKSGLEEKVKERSADLEKNQLAMLYMVQDLNEQDRGLRKMQEKIIHSEKLAVIGQLASSVAHELRNPLGVIKNAVYYLNMLELGKDNADVKENLEIITVEVSNSDKIISDLLEFSRIKKPILRQERVNLIIGEVLRRVKVPSNVEVVTNLAPDLPEIKLDALQMQQVFYNLASNAIQAMEKGGVLTISSRGKESGTDYISVAIKDTGCGILKENLKNIFEPLFSTKAKGTGLGLSVVASLVEGHSGKIEVESEIGKGSVFTVKLPVS